MCCLNSSGSLYIKYLFQLKDDFGIQKQKRPNVGVSTASGRLGFDPQHFLFVD